MQAFAAKWRADKMKPVVVPVADGNGQPSAGLMPRAARLVDGGASLGARAAALAPSVRHGMKIPATVSLDSGLPFLTRGMRSQVPPRVPSPAV